MTTQSTMTRRDPFHSVLSLKPHIEQDATVKKSLSTYTRHNREIIVARELLPYLGSGQHNHHFRIGRVSSVWLAIREPDIEIHDTLDAEIQRSICEQYITRAVSLHRAGRPVPQICGGVTCHGPRENLRYFLIVEDLTCGGTKKLEHAPIEGGMVGSVEGREVHYDLDGETPPLFEKYTYMTRNHMITLDKILSPHK